ncbi:hypothetical protein BaRGS_00000306 [Batillaria attramentaria]|uniref:Uncharacterized protein n=1 Tax=Batillaria attramentaria TaxID=370345 RepID=A0ABD0MC39_9CAEN
MEQPSKSRKPVSAAPKTQAPSPGLLRKKHRMDGQRICRVCGDRAVAHNFDVITCESCKTFFRRNAHKPQKECAFEGKCEITVNTRRFCPACRLKKCFAIGMRADMILDEAERKARMDKIAENRKKRQLALEASKQRGESSSSSDGCSDRKHRTQILECDSSKAEIDSTQDPAGTSVDTVDLLAEEVVPEFQQNVQTSDQAPQSAASGQGQGQSVQVQTDSVSNSRGRACSFEPVPTALLPSDPLMYWRLTAEEHTLLTQLTADYQELLLEHLPVLDTSQVLLQRIESLSLNESMDHSERFIANLVNFLKHIPDFRSLDMSDQLALVKANFMRCFLVKGSVSYSEERDAWLKDNFEVPLSAYVGATQNPELMRRYADFCRITKRVLKNDISGYALLNLLVLLEPQTASLSDRQTVNTLHDKYATLLKHHLESQYSYMFAGQYLEAAWDCLHDSKLVAADMVSLFINFKDFIGPLMAEVMDMKPE